MDLTRPLNTTSQDKITTKRRLSRWKSTLHHRSFSSFPRKMMKIRRHYSSNNLLSPFLLWRSRITFLLSITSTNLSWTTRWRVIVMSIFLISPFIIVTVVTHTHTHPTLQSIWFIPIIINMIIPAWAFMVTSTCHLLTLLNLNLSLGAWLVGDQPSLTYFYGFMVLWFYSFMVTEPLSVSKSQNKNKRYDTLEWSLSLTYYFSSTSLYKRNKAPPSPLLSFLYWIIPVTSKLKYI